MHSLKSAIETFNSVSNIMRISVTNQHRKLRSCRKSQHYFETHPCAKTMIRINRANVSPEITAVRVTHLAVSHSFLL